MHAERTPEGGKVVAGEKCFNPLPLERQSHQRPLRGRIELVAVPYHQNIPEGHDLILCLC